MILTDFIPHTFVSQRASRGFAEQHNPPFTTLSELETLVMDLMCKFSCRGDDNGTNTTSICFPVGSFQSS